MMKLIDKERIIEYDLMRGFAIICVIIGHAYQLGTGDLSMNSYISVEDNSICFFFNGIVNNVIYSFHMPLYMILSGILSYKSMNCIDLKKYIFDRFKRLMIPFFLCGILYCVPIKYLVGYYGEDSLMDAYVDSLLIMQKTGHLWFLLILFLLDVLFVCAFKYNIFRCKYFVFLLIVLYFFHDYLPGGPYLLYKFGNYALYFGIGIYISENEIRKKFVLLCRCKKYMLCLCATLIYVVAFVAEQYLQSIVPIGNALVCNFFGLFEALSAFAIIYFICYYSKRYANKILLYLSKNSFDIYLYHEPLNLVIIYLYIKTGFVLKMNSNGTYLISIIIRIIGCLLGSLIISVFIRKIKKIANKYIMRKSN